MINFSKISTFLIAVLFVISSCSKDSPSVEKSNENELISLKITKNDNPQLQGDVLIYKFQRDYYITLPLGTDLSNVKVSFEYSPKAKMIINNQPISAGVNALDLNETLDITIESEAGTKKKFVVLAHEGVKEMDRLIYEYKTRYNIAGISYAISSTSNSEILYKKGIGFADTQDQERVRPDHLFRLASVSKQFTALSIMKLVDEGKLSVEDQVFGEGGILEEDFGGISARAAAVTVRHLLDHTSGWASNPDPMFSGSFSGRTLNQLITHVLTTPQGQPGGTFSYYNMGYGILGRIIEKVTGKKYETYLKEVLLQAGITDIHVGGDRSQRRPNEVVYYSQDGYNGYANNMEVIAAAGGVIASTEQMLQLLPYIDGRGNIPDMLTPATRDLMFTKSATVGATTFYALGWRGGHRLYPNSYFHSGNIAGTAAMWVIGPEYNAVVLMNSRSYQDGFDDNMYYLLENLLKTSAIINWN